MAKPLVSILLPVYNREKLVRRAIKSAIDQTYKNIEIIVVDNQSTDKTYEILKEYVEKYQNVKVYQNKENIGPVKNWKKCLEYSSGKYTKILFSDDWMEKTFIEKCMDILLTHDNVGFVFTATLIHLNFKGKIFYKFSSKEGLYKTKLFIKGSLCGGDFPVSPCNALFRRADVKNNLILGIPNKLGLNFKENGAGNDLLLFLLTACNYPYFGYISKPLIHFGAQIDSLTISNDLTLQYWVARKYFVDNFIRDKNLKKIFYSMCWLMNVRNRGKLKYLLNTNEISILKILEILIIYFFNKLKKMLLI